MNESPVTEAVSDRAIEWFVRLRGEDVTEDERGEFIQWLREARVHQQAFVETLRMWEDLSVIKEMNFSGLRPFPQIWAFKREVEAKAVG